MKRLFACAAAVFIAGRYFAPDYVRLYLVERPGGTMLFLR